MVMYSKLKIFLILFFKLILHNKEEDQLKEDKELIILIDKVKIINNKIMVFLYGLYYLY